MDFIEGLKAKAREGKARIVLPEGLEERTLKAADVILAEGFAEIILIGNPDDIKKSATTFDLRNIDKAKIVDPDNHEKLEAYTQFLYELRKNKGLTMEQAARLVRDPLYLAP